VTRSPATSSTSSSTTPGIPYTQRQFEVVNISDVDRRAELEKSLEKFDVIVGDLADPVEGGPCYQLYTKCFYQYVLKPKLHERGIFVTQANQAPLRQEYLFCLLSTAVEEYRSFETP
jgi:spermidine synthase